MSTKDRLYLFDTTLRDGNQSQGVDFNVQDKHAIALALDGLGIDYVEAGWPGSNPTDTEFFAAPPALSHATLTAFGMTRRPGRTVGDDANLLNVLAAKTGAVCLVGKTWDYHVEVALGTTLTEAVDLISDSIAHAAKSHEAMFDAEHFFDGFKSNPDFTMQCVQAAADAGARWVVLCDTNGGTLPHEIERIVGEVAKIIPGDHLGIHAQNDTENAVANSLAAVRAGARQVQGTLNGIGERCGNANLVSLIPTFILKPEFADHLVTDIGEDKLQSLTSVSRFLDERLNRAPNAHAPYVGDAAFAHKGGLHGSAVAKDPRTYEHVPPDAVGNVRHVLVSNQAGRANVVARLSESGIEISADDPRLATLISDMKEREHLGYAYDGAEASFELMALRAMGTLPDYFLVKSFRVIVERRYNAKGDLVTTSDATVKSVVDGEIFMSVGEGNGPVNALDDALRKDLGKYSAFLEDLELVDFKVRILSQGTGAVTRVMLESLNGAGERWTTVGVSANIIDASFQALYDAMVYKLFRAEAPPARPKAAE